MQIALQSARSPQRAILITIDVGDGRFTIKHKLYRAGVLSILCIWILWLLEAGRFQPRAGEYKIPAGASLAQIITLLNSGKTYQRRMTIIEGWRSYDVMLALNEAEGLSSVILRPPPEGSVFPDTYYYTKGMDRRANYWPECRKRWKSRLPRYGQSAAQSAL